MSSHLKEIAVDVKTGVSKVVELGKAAVTVVLVSRETKVAAAIGFGVGVFAVLTLRLIF